MSFRFQRAVVLELSIGIVACAAAPQGAPVQPPPAARPAAETSAGVPSPSVPPKPRTMTVLVSSEASTTYCNGEQMDSAGYRKTLTREKRIELPPEGATATEVARAVLAAATEGMCNTVMSQLEYRREDGALHIPPFDAWAGVSITMCSCQPEVEVNLARIPGVTRVVWDGD